MKTKHQILMESIDYKPRKVMRIDDVNAMADANIRENEINKLAEKVYLEHENNDLLYGESLELRLAYKAGIVDGYNKAKETMYTKEQLIVLVESLKNYTKEAQCILGNDEREANEFVETFIDVFLLKNHLK